MGEILRTADIGAHATQHIEDLMQDPWVRAHGLSLTQTLEGVGEMTMPGAAPRLSRTPLAIGKPVRPVGADGPGRSLAELRISRKREES